MKATVATRPIIYQYMGNAGNEVFYSGSGTFNSKNNQVFYSCNTRKHVEGTGFVVNKRIKHLLEVHVKNKT